MARPAVSLRRASPERAITMSTRVSKAVNFPPPLDPDQIQQIVTSVTKLTIADPGSETP
ncbi:hypothetical protein XH86_28715 [Bradyrhizobium guangdongense]|uniref:Uncharacterized protein n=1 Tax=Bradyrhizobium guangdongense TaxID=1325090 RepID=A0ABX6ULM9_9BRAD|nr:hypothetical protein X265_28680 [Bradyrhizobium guangdongense]QOZ62278.1 hypothetical protein XH86_28715 [Bradyrhizobium guangdongense]